jgi:thymidylate kinase
MDRRTIIKNFFQKLNETNIPYVFLRYFDRKIKSSDYDIDIFTSGITNTKNIAKTIKKFFCDMGGVIFWEKNSALCYKIVALSNKNPNFETDLFVFEIRSIYRTKAKIIFDQQILQYRYLDTDGIFKLDFSIEAILIILRNVFLQREFSSEYEDYIWQHRKEAKEKIKLFVKRPFLITKLDERINQKRFHDILLLRKEFYYALNTRLSHWPKLFYYFLYYVSYLLKNIFCPKGKTILILGPDGSGKTTIVQLISKQLNSKRIQTCTAHFYQEQYSIYGFFLRLFSLDRKAIESKNKSKSKQSPWFNAIRQILLIVNGIISYFLFFKWRLIKGQLIIFDRYYTDIFLKAFKNGLKISSLALFLSNFTPKPSMVFLLCGSSKIIRQRKAELEPSDIQFYYDFCMKYYKKKYIDRFFVIDIAQSLDVITREIISHILQNKPAIQC